MKYLIDNYLLVITILAFVVFAIIGYIVDSKKNKGSKQEKEILTEEIKEDNKINNNEKEVDLNNLTK